MGKSIRLFYRGDESEMEVVEYRGGLGTYRAGPGIWCGLYAGTGEKSRERRYGKDRTGLCRRYVERYGLSEDKCGFDVGA